MFNRVRNHKDVHALWLDVCALHEGTKSEREERYHLVMKKLNSFKMLLLTQNVTHCAAHTASRKA